MRAMKNYAGHRLSPWLGHLMVSRQETARPLLTPGEVMQLPPGDEIVMVAGIHPIRARKARYYEDSRFKERILPPPALQHRRTATEDDWSGLGLPERPDLAARDLPSMVSVADEDPTESEKRRQPELSSKAVPEPSPTDDDEFDADRDAHDEAAILAQNLNRSMQRIARQADLDPGDGML
jgi:type IV secretion system protein VirD4